MQCRRPFALVLLGIGGLLISAAPAAGQTPYAVLHAFTLPGTHPPPDSLVQVSSNFYGTTTTGGRHGGGTIYRISSAGVVTTIQHFDCGPAGSCLPTGLTLASDGFLYGMTANGGVASQGSIYRIDVSGSMNTIHSFNCANGEGCQPQSPLAQAADGFLYGSAGNILFKISTTGVFTSFHTMACAPYPVCGQASALTPTANGLLYGTTSGTGDSDGGRVFRMDAAGTVTTLVAFSACTHLGLDPCDPGEGVVQGSDGFFYGVTMNGGDNRSGTAFRMDSTGTVTTLHTFGGHPRTAPVLASDGFFYGTTSTAIYRMDTSGNVTTVASSFECDSPEGCFPGPGKLMQASDGRIYGATNGDGPHGDGTVFRSTTAGDFTILHEFGATSTGTDPNPGLAQAPDGTLYGTTVAGGPTGWGTVFSIDRRGSAEELHSFDCASDGCQPLAGVIRASDGALYGITSRGGSADAGTVFKVTTAGAFMVLHAFACGSAGDGCQPEFAGLLQAGDGNLYGTTSRGGATGNGIVFRMTPAGVFTILHSFDCNADGGCTPVYGLIEGGDGRLYGVTPAYGTVPDFIPGSIYGIDTAGTFTSIQSFPLPCAAGQPCSPRGLLLETGGALYGASNGGGTGGTGTVFKKVVNGPLTVLHSFDCATEGCNPDGGLMLAANGDLHGTTTVLGPLGAGTVYRMTSSGSVTVEHSFACVTDGCRPSGTLLHGDDGDLYGIAQEGSRGGGVVFELGATHPGEASPGGDMTVSPNAGTSVTLNYTPACGASSHVIYWGTSPIAGALAWTDAACDLGSSGIAGFDPGTPPVGRFFYFVIVGQSGVEEGSYGRNAAGAERPEAQGVGACDRPQVQTLVCP